MVSRALGRHGVIVGHDAERNVIAALRRRITGEGIDVSQRAGLSAHYTLQRRVLKAIGQGAIHARDGQCVLEEFAPALLVKKDQQLNQRFGGDQVFPRQSRIPS